VAVKLSGELLDNDGLKASSGGSKSSGFAAYVFNDTNSNMIDVSDFREHAL